MLPVLIFNKMKSLLILRRRPRMSQSLSEEVMEPAIFIIKCGGSDKEG